MKSAPPRGTTVRILLEGCDGASPAMRSSEALLPLLEEAARAIGLTPLERAGHDFEGAGHTSCLLLAESHIAVHTYPERGGAALVELSVCDHRRENGGRARDLARRIADLFAPGAQTVEVLPFAPAKARGRSLARLLRHLLP